MPDITQCPKSRCSDRFKCYRFMAIPDERQVYFIKPPYDKDGCRYFMEFAPKKNRRGSGKGFKAKTSK